MSTILIDRVCEMVAAGDLPPVDERLPVDQVVVGDRLRIRPGDKIPLDGEVLSGASDVNQASITGLALPLTYDNSGNLTRDEAGRGLVYDAWDRLVEVNGAPVTPGPPVLITTSTPGSSIHFRNLAAIRSGSSRTSARSAR